MFYRYYFHKNIEEYSKEIRSFQKKWNLKPHHFKSNKNYKPKVIITNKQNKNVSDTNKILDQLVNIKKHSDILHTTSRFSKLKNLKLIDKILPAVTVIPIVCSAVIKKTTSVASDSFAKQSTAVLDSEKLSSIVSDTIAEPTVSSGTSEVFESLSAAVSDSEIITDVSNSTAKSSTVSEDFIAEPTVSNSSSEGFESTSSLKQSTIVPDSEELLQDVPNSTAKSSTVSEDFIAEPTVSNSSSEGFESISSLKQSTIVPDSEELLQDASGSIAEPSTFASDTITSSSTSGVFETVFAASSKPLSESLGFGSWSWILQKCSEYVPSFDILSRPIKNLIKSEELSSNVSDSNNAGASTVNSDSFETASSDSSQSIESIFESVSETTKPIVESVSTGSWIWFIQKLLEYLPSLDITGSPFIFGVIVNVVSKIIGKIVSPKILNILNSITARYRRVSK